MDLAEALRVIGRELPHARLILAPEDLAALGKTPEMPEVLSTVQAARLLGYTPKRWRRWAEQGRVDGAWQDGDGRWRLPREACRAHLGRLSRQPGGVNGVKAFRPRGPRKGREAA